MEAVGEREDARLRGEDAVRSGRGASCFTPASGVGGGSTAAAIMMGSSPMTARDFGGLEITSGFNVGRRGLAISTGRTSSRTMITRVPSLARCHSRTAKSFFRRIQPCEAARPGTSPACSAMPDHVSRCMSGIGAAL